MEKTLIIISALLTASFSGLAAQVSDSTGFRTASAANVVELLTGKVSGVRVSAVDGNPAGALNINIRGINTLRSDNQPIWIVDGAMLSTDLNQNLDPFWQYSEQSYSAQLNPLAFLNPYEIESIEVLKDISSTAIYGVRGANGVIIVKTKMGRGAQRNIDWSSNLGVNLDRNHAVSHNHYLAFNGTKNNTSYNISGTFRNVTGNLARSKSNYGSLKANFETHSNSFLWFGFNSLVSVGGTDSPSAVTYLGQPSMTLALRNPALSPATTAEEWASEFDDKSNDYRAVTSASLRINFLPSLYLKADAGIDYQYNKRVLWYGKGTSFGAPSAENENGGFASNVISRLFSYNADLKLCFERYFASVHRLSATAGVEFLGNLNDFNTLNGNNFVIDDLRGLGLKTGSYVINHHKYEREYSHLAAFATAAYDFKGIAGISGTFRWDNTAKYQGAETHIYPAGEAWFDVRGLLFKNFTPVSALKIKGGYGKSGLEKYIPYELTGNYLSGTWYEVPENTGMYHDGIDRVTTTESHVTLETGFLSNRIRLAATWFDRTTEDKYVLYQMADGKTNLWKRGCCNQVYDRVNKIRNRGYEFDLSALIINSSGWKWNVSANLALNENRITEIASTDFQGRKVGNGLFATCNSIGQSVSSLYGYKTDADGNFLDITGEGFVNEADKVILGHSVPKYYGGLQSDLSWGGFTLEIAVDGAAGHNIANLQDILLRRKTDSDGLISLCDKDVERGDYLRLSEVGLKYRIPVKVSWMRDLSVRLSARNLVTFTNYSGWNPDVNCFGNGSLSSGLDYGSYPVLKTIMLGVSAKF